MYVVSTVARLASVFGVLLVAMALMVASASADAPICSKLADEAKSLVAEANFCEIDMDCRWQLYGSPFECFSLVNKTFAQSPSRLDEIIAQRQANNCDIIYQDIDCDTSSPPAGAIKCQNGMCVDAR